MGIRIDLLPRYVGLKRWFKRILLACLSLVGIFAAVLFLLFYREQLRLQTLTTNRDEIKKVADAAAAAASAAEAAKTTAKPFQDTVNFFVDAGRTGAERAALLDVVHRYLYSGAVISSLDLSDGQNIKFTATLKTPDEYANFLNNLRRGTAPAGILFADLPSGAGILGYPNDEVGKETPAAGQPAAAPGAPGAAGAAANVSSVKYWVYHNNITAQGKLREPVTVPTAPGEAATPAAGAPGAPPPP
jgi:hypothetical protein